MQPFLLYTDGDPQNQPDKSSRLNINVNIDWESGTISTEDGNELVVQYPSIATQGANIIGKIPLRDNNIVLFSVIEGATKTVSNTQSRSTKGEIGILSSDNSYRVLLRDKIDSSIDLGWDLNTQIQGTYKIGTNNDTIIYWVDNVNELRYLNLDNPQVDVDSNYQLTSISELDKLNILKLYSRSAIELDSVDNGGSLKSGDYYIVCAYADEQFNESNLISPSNAISIVPSVSENPVSSYDGSAANTATSKSITFTIPNVDTDFSYVKVYLISKINSVYSVYDYSYIPITSSTFTYTISTTENAASSTLDILIDKVNWIAKTITQLDNKLYIGNLKKKDRISLQPYINNIIVDTFQNTKDLENFEDSFHSEKLVYSSRCFHYDEVYALYAVPVYKDGSLGEAYHIPGRSKESIDIVGDSATYTVEENDIISESGINDIYIYVNGTSADTSPGGQLAYIDEKARFFHAFDTSYNPNASTNLGYWENQDETYPNTNDWLVLDSDGTTTATIAGNKVRHHKTPARKYLNDTSDPTQANLLGFTFYNIKLPEELEGEIVGLKFYYAKRTNNNKLVLGQSLFLHDVELTNWGGGAITDGSGQDSTDWVFSLGSNFELGNFEAGGVGGTPVEKKMERNYSFGRMNPFDTMVNNSDTTQASYIKFTNKMTFNIAMSSWTGSAISDPTGAGGMAYTNSIYCFQDEIAENTKFSSYIRKIRKIALSESLPTYSSSSDRSTGANNSTLGFSKKVIHYRGDKSLTIELEQPLEASLYTDNVNYVEPRDTTLRSITIMLANLCSFKTNVYNSFDSQELVDTGGYLELTSDAFNGTGQTGPDLYGGDTFISYHGHRGVADIVFALNFNTDTTISTVGEWRTVHLVTVESVGNINYRHEGTGQYDIYYPKSDVESVLAVPLIPNGFGNYYAYNSDYSSVNDLVQPVLHSKITSLNVDKYPTRIARSATDNPEGKQDNYLVFLANEYTDIEKSKGEINNIVNYQNSLVIQCQNSIKQTATRDRMKTDSSEAYLGAGDLFDYPPKDLILTETGYGGLQNQFSSVLTQYGIFYVDTNSANIFLLGEGLQALNKNSLEIFCLRNLKLTFYDTLRTSLFSITSSYNSATTYASGRIVKYNNSIWRSKQSTTGNTPLIGDNWELLYSFDTFTFKGQDSIFYGYVGGFDSYYKRYLLTKKDIIPTANFTTFFVGEYDSVSFSSWTTSNLFFYDNQLYIKRSASGTDIVEFQPGRYALPIYFNNSTYFTPDRFTLAYYPDYKGFASWQEYTPDNYFSSQLNFYSQRNTVVSQHNDDTKLLVPTNTGPATTVIEPIFNGKEVTKLMSLQWKTKSINPDNNNEDYLSTFDSLQVYDSYQISKEVTISNTTNARNIEGYWSSNDFRDFTTDNSVNVVNPDLWYRPFNVANISSSKHWTKLKRLVDYWFGVRFKYLPATETSCSIITARLVAPAGSLSYTNDTYLRALINVNPLLGATFTVGDVLKIEANSQTFYAYVNEAFSANEWQLKLYGPINISSNTMVFTSVSKVSRRNKLHLLDLTSVKLKNIR